VTPCFYGIDTDNQSQLIGANMTVSEIADHIGADSLSYLSLNGMLETTHQDTSNFCSACFDGKYPIEIPEVLKRSKLILETA
jgi:amidophosphoribosyltransferase